MQALRELGTGSAEDAELREARKAIAIAAVLRYGFAGNTENVDSGCAISNSCVLRGTIRLLQFL